VYSCHYAPVVVDEVEVELEVELEVDVEVDVVVEVLVEVVEISVPILSEPDTFSTPPITSNEAFTAI
jgi:hypothetical protein